MERIDSLQNVKIKRWAKLHQKKERDETGLFLVEGEHLVSEAMKAGAVEVLLTDGKNPFSFDNTIFVNEQILHKLSENVSTPHLIAVCRKIKPAIKNDRRLLLLDGIQDPGNMGTLIRTAMAFSFDGIYVSEDSCDLYNEKTIRSTQGALFQMPVIRTDLASMVQKLQDEGVNVVAATLQNALPMREIHAEKKMAFILGNEGNGVRKELQKMADQRLRIEMHGFESLNVAVAGGIIMYQYRNQ